MSHIALTAKPIAPAVHLVAMTADQMKLVEHLIGPSVVDDRSPDNDTESLSTNLARALDQAALGQEEGIFVSLYETNQVYGGPEEGGWWWWASSLVKSVWATSFEDAVAEADTMLKSFSEYDPKDNPEWYEELSKRMPTAEELFKYFSKPEDYKGESISREWSISLEEVGSRSYDDHCRMVFEYQPGMHSTIRREIYC